MKKISTFLKELFFVPKCAVCGGEPDDHEDGVLCRVCRNRYENEKNLRCGVCHRHYRECDCRPEFASMYIQNYLRVAHYREDRVAGKLVLAAKDRAHRPLNDFLAGEMAEAVKARGVQAQVICYIPCSDESYRKRGFDHGKQLAQALGRKLDLPIVDCFVRKSGKAQKDLNARQRLENAKNSLSCQKKAASLIKDRHVLLIDDIMTTGASALVASVHLDEMGAKTVDFVSFSGR